MKRVFSGVQPTGGLTLGNYLGAIKHFVRLQEEYDCFYCVVDLHALTVPKDPKELRTLIVDTAAYMMAAGLDPEKVTLFVQSDVPAHSELSWIMECTATFGELSRMTQFKEKSEGRESVSGGLFTYPALMAADILLYDTDVVPVGEDQKQHVELARDLAIRFNSRYGDTFKVPEPVIPKTGARIKSLADPSRKMSKSDTDPYGAIFLGDSEDEIVKKVRRAVTDSGREIIYDPDNKPALANLLTIYSHCADIPIEKLEEMYAGKGYADFKKGLAEAVIQCLKPIQKRHREMSESGYVKEALVEGARKAMEVSTPVLKRAKERLGLPNHMMG
ncbi:MAG TPA: tryptophan--tRNA ligase [Firmicutes bacterium]|nr:tryptophan--tRNA ligase [Candidatus Fermentithermobacillaceae bacterium]